MGSTEGCTEGCGGVQRGVEGCRGVYKGGTEGHGVAWRGHRGSIEGLQRGHRGT